jgi:ribosomal protein S6-L-glutamate ligase RimK-like protein
MRICVIGDPADLTAAYVGWLARRDGCDVLELSERELGVTWWFALDDAPAGGARTAGHLEVAGTRLPVDEIDGAFVRLNPAPGLPDGVALGPEEEQIFIAERRAGLEYLLEALPFPVVNRPSAGRANGSKPHQMRLLARAGFDVPAWVVTNRPSPAEVFVRGCEATGGAIYKACSGLRSRVRRVDDELDQRLRRGTSPVLLQAYIPGRDVRVHTVGGQAFGTEITTEVVDYRFDEGTTSYRAVDVPDGIATLCADVAREERLSIAGFDFRVTDEGRWYCLEVNPVPTFLPYEMATGQGIGAAVLDLMRVRCGPRGRELSGIC